MDLHQFIDQGEVITLILIAMLGFSLIIMIMEVFNPSKFYYEEER